jgi:uncharacterized protein YegJ (DUF2314 family)
MTKDFAFAAFFLCCVGFAAIMLLMKERGRLLGEVVSKAFGLVMLLGGLLYANVAIGILSKTSITAFYESWFNASPFLLAPMLFWMGLKWLFYQGRGIEIEGLRPDFRSRVISEAANSAGDALPYLIEQARQYVDGAYILFPSITDKGVTEHVWAYVHHYENGIFNVSPVDKPHERGKRFAERRDVPESDVQDWKIEFADGRIKGAYSYITALQYLERSGRLNRTMRKQKEQLLDAKPAIATSRQKMLS